MKGFKKQKLKKGTPTADDKMQMKVLDDLGYNKTEIGKIVGRGYRAVTTGLRDFEVLLVNDSDLQNKFSDEKEKFIEKMIQNSAMIMVAADHVVANKLGDSTAMEAAKISQLYANRLDGLSNLSDSGLNGKEGEKNKVVINYIEKVFNTIQK